jgi:NAD(P)H-flavin reductase
MAIEDYKAIIKSIKEVSENTRIFKLELNNEIVFKAGQFMTFILEENGQKFTAPYSIASNPSENKTLQFAIKLVKSGKATTCIWGKKEGEILNLKGPIGGFGIKGSNKENLIFIGTGTGIAPLRSMIKNLLEKNTKKNLTLIFGERFENGGLFREEFQSLKKQYKNFKFIQVVSKPSDNYKGKKGYVQEVLEDLDIKNSEAYLCGIPGMVKGCKEKLIKMGMSKEDIFFEKY